MKCKPGLFSMIIRKGWGKLALAMLVTSIFMTGMPQAASASTNELQGQWYFQKIISVSGGGQLDKWERDLKRELGWEGDGANIVFADASSGSMKTIIVHRSVETGERSIEYGMVPFTYTAGSGKLSMNFAVNGQPGDTFDCTYALKGNDLQIKGFPDERVEILLKRK
ncbi:MAG: hypothetical protein LBM00_10745 [Deltaproteobacteria bacterium]|nr:hypothetical protein [Deltaproteobacteria bacterium]